MCGRFTVYSTPKEIKQEFNIKQKLPLFSQNYNVAPSQQIPAVIKNSPNRLTLMQWGFIPEWANPAKTKFKPINARADKLDGGFYKKAYLQNRCLIPANGFYEWKKVTLEGKEEKIPYFIHLKDRELFGFAGIYSMHLDAEKKPHYFAAIITTSANTLMKSIHTRMPVIIHKKDEENWLNSDTSDKELQKYIKKYESSKMEAWKVDKRVGNAANNDKNLLNTV